MMKNNALFLLVLLVFFSCREEISKPKNQPKYEYDSLTNMATIEEHWYNGKVSLRYKMQNAQRIGTIEYYYPNGNIKTKGQYHNDMLHGELLMYDSAGALITSVFMRNGLRYGCSYGYDKNGDTISISNLFFNTVISTALKSELVTGSCDYPFLIYSTIDSLQYKENRPFNISIYLGNKLKVSQPKMIIDKIFEDGEPSYANIELRENKNDSTFSFFFEPLKTGVFEFEGYFVALNKYNKQVYIPFYLNRKVK